MMALSACNTPRATPRKITKKSTLPPQTPECYNNVTVETPVSSKTTNREKCDEISNLKVAVRVRPLNARELATGGVSNVVSVDKQELTIRNNPGGLGLNTDHVFQYDHIFWSCDETSENYCNQSDVFVSIGHPLLNSAFKGYNACLFAYGQTGSGKSYSMMGLYEGDNLKVDSNSGIIPRFCESLFDKILNIKSTCSVSVEVTYFEIYNEKIHDLLAMESSGKQPLKVREHPSWGPYVVGLSVHKVACLKEIQDCLVVGNKNRASSATCMNDQSSRSHSIFSVEINLAEASVDGESYKKSKVSLVDLAGSERLNNYVGNSEERLKQGVYINKSLLTLGKVILALADQKKGQQFVPYRDSVLTWLLRESLGGNSLTYMLATITPASSNVDETLATLRYACQARTIVNRARVNEDPHDRLIRELRAEVDRLRTLRQDYEANASIIHIDDSIEHGKELEELRSKLNETERKLQQAQERWELRFTETKEKQMKELVAAEKRKEELESHLRVIKTTDSDVNLSPYKTNFLEELEGVLTENKENRIPNINVTQSMNQVYSVINTFKPLLRNENDQLLFARVNKLLQALEATLKNNINKSNVHKTVSFKL